MASKKISVVILIGGPSAEHEVSLRTGAVILNALDSAKYNLRPVTITKEGKWLLPARDKKLLGIPPAQASQSIAPLEISEALDHLKSERGADVVFIAMHGTYGEDGTIQGLLELAGIPYTGSGILASALAMDKLKSAELLAFHTLNVPKCLHFSHEEWEQKQDLIAHSVEKQFGFPCVIKPRNCGSSVGVTIVKRFDHLENAIKLASTYSSHILAQEFIDGSEVTCAVLDEGGGKEPIALPPTQIIPKDSEFFDYHAKYTPGATEEITPPRLPAEIIKKIQDNALRVHKIIGCSGMSRTDMIVKGDEIYVLETNTIPGMTKTSLYPQAAAAVGISFSELLDKIIHAALRRKK